MVDVVQRDVPHAAELDALVGRGGRAGRGHGHDHRLVLGQVEVAGRGELGGQATRRGPGRGHRVDRFGQVEPLGEGEERPQPGQQDLAGHGIALGQRRGVRRRRRPAGFGVPVLPPDADRAPAFGAPVAVHLADQQHRGPGPEGEIVAPSSSRCPGAEAHLERAVSGDLDGPVVERAQAVRHLDRGVVPLQHLEAQVGGAAAAAGDHVLGVIPQVGVEVKSVRVVQAHLGVRAGRLHEVREVPLVGPGQPQRRLDAARQVVVSLGEVLLAGDVRGARDDLLGLGQRLSERPRQHQLAPRQHRALRSS